MLLEDRIIDAYPCALSDWFEILCRQITECRPGIAKRLNVLTACSQTQERPSYCPAIVCPAIVWRPYCPDGAAAVLSGTGATFPGVALSNRVRNGKKGVTSNGIFSAAEVMATGLVLINSS